MNEIERLLQNILALLTASNGTSKLLIDEFMVFAEENPNLYEISELNEIIESEMSYWAENA